MRLPSLFYLLFSLLIICTPLNISRAAADTIDVNLPFEKFTLNNGLTVVVHEDRKAPVIAIQVMYDVGSKDEPQGQTGFAHLFEHLMFNGSENFDDDYFVALKDMGATQYNGTTSTDRTNYYQTVPTGAFEQILFLESDRMGHLLGAVTQEKLDNQIGVVKNEKKVGDDRPFGRRIWYNIFENLYPVGHPYHHPTIGSMEDVGNATLEDVQDWFNKYYGAANAVLVLAGDIDTQTARPLVEKYFGHIPSGPPLVKANTNSVPLLTNKHGVFYDRVDQPRLYRAYIAPPTGSETSPLLDLMTRALASGKTSRLYKRLVDELELVNNINAGYSESMLSGQIYFITDVKRAQDIDRVNDIIDAEIAQFLKDGPTKDELQRAKTIYLSSEVRGLESVAGKAATLARGELFFGDPDFYVEENLNRMQAATRQQVREASAKYLQHGYYELQVLPFGQYQSSQAQYDRAQGLPDRGTPGELTFPETEEFTLSNGISVVVAPRPTIPVVELALQFDAGTATGNIAIGERSEALPYLAPMTTALMDEGTEKRSAQDIAELAEELGARIRIGNSKDSSSAYLSALKPNFAQSLDLLSDIVRNATFPPQEIEKFRARAIDSLRQGQADNQQLGSRALNHALYGDRHPYGAFKTVNASIQGVEQITQQDLIAWRNSWLRPDNVTIFASGDVTAENLRPLLEKQFGKWQAQGPQVEKNMPQLSNPAAPKVIVINKPDTQQSLILAGRLIPPVGARNDTAIAAMNDSFGGSFLSRINMNLREDKGWSYGVRSGAGGGVGQRLFTIQAPVQSDKTGAAIAELRNEMAGVLQDRPFTQDELDQTTASVVGASPGQFETASAVLRSMMGNSVYGRPLDYAVGRAERYRALTLDDLADAATEVIDPQSLTWVIVGDWQTIESQIVSQNIGPIEVREAVNE